MCEKPPTDTSGLSPDDALSEMQNMLRLRHCSPRTEGSYLGWARRFLARRQGVGNTQPTAVDVKSYISHLAIDRKVAAATQNQAFILKKTSPRQSDSVNEKELTIQCGSVFSLKHLCDDPIQGMLALSI